MLPKTAIETLISELNNRIPPPVHTAGIEEERPVPAVIIENIQLEDKNHHNTDHAGSETDTEGNVTAEIYRHYYDLRISLEVRDDDEVNAWSLLGDLKIAIDDLSENTQVKFHPDVKNIRPVSSGPVNYQYHEPKETEISQSLVIETFYDTTNSDFDVIGSFENNIDIY